jgi:hypothetical protein
MFSLPHVSLRWSHSRGPLDAVRCLHYRLEHRQKFGSFRQIRTVTHSVLVTPNAYRSGTESKHQSSRQRNKWLLLTSIVLLGGAGITTYETYEPFRHTCLAAVRCSRVASELILLMTSFQLTNCCSVAEAVVLSVYIFFVMISLKVHLYHQVLSTTRERLHEPMGVPMSKPLPLLNVIHEAQSAFFKPSWRTEVGITHMNTI